MADKNVFINPYTFVELNNKKALFSGSDSDKKITGKIGCTLITKTQIAIPDIPVEENGYNMPKHPFFRIERKAVIPGSGIRGVVRSVYEVLTDSCMHINDKDSDYFSSRQNKSDTELISYENGKYILYKAERVKITLDNSHNRTDKKLIIEQNKILEKSGYRIGRKCRVIGTAAERGRKTTTSDLLECNKYGKGEEGYYMKADTLITGTNHNNPSVFIKKKKQSDLNESAIKLLMLNIDEYNPADKYSPEKATGTKKQYKDCFEKMKKGETFLSVWYYEKKGKYYLAPSQMSRSFFYRKPKDILKEMGYSACSRKSELCEACALFGTVGKGYNTSVKKSEAISGHLRFGDAVCTNDSCFDEYRILPVLGSPRLSSFEFYLINNNDKNSYDPDDPNTKLSGRKFYWHHSGKEIREDDKKAIEAAKKATNKDNFVSKGCCFELVKKGETFSFDIFFEDITKKQLEMLVFALNFGENDPDSPLCHKIGHGKSVGLGSVKIVVDKIIIRDYSDGKYTISPDVKEDYYSDGRDLFKENIIEQILKVVNMDTIEDCSLIGYPHTLTSDDIFDWFAKNRKSLKSIGTISFFSHLPNIMEDPKLPKDQNNNKNYVSTQKRGNRNNTPQNDRTGQKRKNR